MKFPTVDKRYTANGKQVTEVVKSDRSAWSCHIADASSPELAARIAKALGLLAVFPGTLDEGEAIMVASVELPESEILARAREAAIAEGFTDYPVAARVRLGDYDEMTFIKSAARALRDLAKPLSEVVPAVDGDLVEARKIAHDEGRWLFKDDVLEGKHDDGAAVQMALAAIRRGRELGMTEAAKIVRSTVVSSPADSFEAHVRNELADTVLAIGERSC